MPLSHGYLDLTYDGAQLILGLLNSANPWPMLVSVPEVALLYGADTKHVSTCKKLICYIVKIVESISNRHKCFSVKMEESISNR
jgi:hypothetical protein